MENFTEIQVDAFTEVGDFIMGAAASVISEVAGNETVIDSPVMETVSISEAKAAFSGPVVAIDITYNSGFGGNSSFIFHADDMAVLYNLASGFDASEPGADLENIADSELGDVISQLVNQVVNAMSEIFDRLIVIGPPVVRYIPSPEVSDLVSWGEDNDAVLKVDYQFNIDSVLDSSLTQIIPMQLAKSMVNILLDVEEDELSADVADNEGDSYSPPPPEFEGEEDSIELDQQDDFIIPEEESLADQPSSEDYETEDLSDLRGPVTSDDGAETEVDDGELPDFQDEGEDVQPESPDEPGSDDSAPGGSTDYDLSSVSSDDLALGGAPEVPPEEDSSSSLSQDELSKLITGMDEPAEGEAKSDADSMDDVASLFADATKDKKPEEGKGDESGSAEDAAALSEAGEEEEELSYEESIEKLELIRDIPIEMTVILGENQLLLKDLVSAGKGSMVSLNRYAREPVDIKVNDQVVARGEVVVVDGRIGVRIVSIETRFPKINYEKAAK